MTAMLIASNMTRENGQFMGDQLCSLKAAYLFVENRPADVDKIIVALSPKNEMHFLWQKFIDNPALDGSLPACDVVYDTFDPGDNPARWIAWDKWRAEREIEGKKFSHYRELYLRIHGAMRQVMICGSERGLERKNIYEYLYFGQEDKPESVKGSDWFDDTLIYHPQRVPQRDVYISPHCKTQGNVTFTFDYWARVVRKLLDARATVTLGYDGVAGPFCDDLNGHPFYKRHWGDHRQWMEELCRHKIVACGNTGTGWLAAACGVPMITMEPHNSVMADHRYRECGLRNIVEVIDGYKLDEFNNDMSAAADYCARRILEEVNRRIVLTTGCYDVLHAGHVRHLQRARELGTRLIVAMNSDESVRKLKGPTRPINPQDQRRTVLEALRCVDEVRVFDGDDAMPIITALKPDVLACGFGYTLDRIVGREFVEGYGGQVVVTCQGDAALEPSTTKIVKRALRSGDIVEVCRLACSASVNPFDKLKLMADELLKTLHLPGDMADLGACRGGTSLVLRRLAPEKHLHLFDTWQGTPIDDELCHHKKGEWSAKLEDCVSLVGNGDLTHYWVGVFPHARKNCHDIDLLSTKYCFVFVDPDTYQAVRDAIEFFWPRMVPGGRMVFDDYGWHACQGVKKAVDEAFAEDCRVVVPAQFTCAVVKK